jgi:hypothetical protein
MNADVAQFSAGVDELFTFWFPAISLTLYLFAATGALTLWRTSASRERAPAVQKRERIAVAAVALRR